MPRSRRFRNLQTRIKELRSHLLPKTFDPTGTYAKRQLDRACAFRLMAHAEIEWYLEQIVIETANKAFDAWEQRGLITKPLLALVAYVDVHLGVIALTKSGEAPPDLATRVEKCKNRFNTYVNTSNHGVKEENILKLLLPVGISGSDIDQTWLLTTSSFGRLRGEVAHVSNQVYNPPDPKNEFDIVTQAIEGLSDIDETLVKLQSL